MTERTAARGPNAFLGMLAPSTDKQVYRPMWGLGAGGASLPSPGFEPPPPRRTQDPRISNDTTLCTAYQTVVSTVVPSCRLPPALRCLLCSLCLSLTSVLNPDPSLSELPSSLEPLDDDEVPGRSAWGHNSPPALAHELTTLELSPNDYEDDTSVRIGDRPASRHRCSTRRASPFRFLLLGCISLPNSASASALSSPPHPHM